MNRDHADEKNGLPEQETAFAEDVPAEPSGPEFEVGIYRDWCKSCGICAAFCPRKCLSLDDYGSPVVNPDRRCSGCRWCELHCPDFAICVRELEAKGEKEKGKEVKG